MVIGNTYAAHGCLRFNFMEIILELLAELFLQFVFEAIADFGIHKSTRSKEVNPIWAAAGYSIFGAFLGFVSLLIFPESFIQTEGLKLVNLIGTPIMLGFIMLAIGKVRDRRGKATVRIEKFFYGFLFAFGLALVRFLFTS